MMKEGSITLSVTSESPASVAFSLVMGPATVVGNVVHFTGCGHVVLSAKQAASGKYPAASATAAFDIVPAPPGLAITDTWSDPNRITLSSASASPAPVIFAVVSGPAVLVDAKTLAVSEGGQIAIRATQVATESFPAASADTVINVSAPHLVLSVPTLQFSQETVGTASLPQAITLQNTGDLSAPLQKISVSTGFLLSNSCSTSLAAHSSCALGVTFAPSTSGAITGNVAVATNATSILVGLMGVASPARIPMLVSSSLTSIPSGAQTEVHFYGSNLDLISSLIVGSSATQIKHISATEVSSVLAPPTWLVGDVNVKAGYDSGVSNTLTLTLVGPAVSYDTAVRFAQQATMAVTPDEIQQIQSRGLAGWIDWQMSTPMFPYETRQDMAYGTYMSNALVSQFALRQRTVLALKKIYVLGPSSRCFEAECGHYWEARLQKDAFGNVRDLLSDITLSPLMGFFLSNAENWMQYPYVDYRRANQNYARELQQLMTIGPVQLNHDGSTVLDASGRMVQNYSEDNISDMAAAMSGYWSANLNYFAQVLAGDPLIPMVANESAHSPLTKNPLPGLQLPANQGAVADTKAVLDALFNHPNTSPFLARRLIQSFVSSNPSPEYISRVADVFDNDGSGVRGNLGAVVKAILLDPEARRGDDPNNTVDTDSHMMEPLLFVTNAVAATGATFTDDRIYLVTGPLGEDLFMAPSVFGPYSPDNRIPTGEFAPEAQLVSTSGYVTRVSFVRALVNGGTYGVSGNLANSPFANASNATEIIERMRHFLFHGKMPEAVEGALQDYATANPALKPNDLLPGMCMIALTNSSYQVLR